MTVRNFFDLSVYFVVDPSLCRSRDIVDIVAQAVKGGVSMVQLRDKDAMGHEIKAAAEELLKFTRPAGVPLIINDRPDIAKEIDADGVHLGQGDMSPAEARAIIGPNKILGLTAFTSEHFEMLDPYVVDYAGTGPFFETQTDKGKSILGAKKFAALVAMSKVPVVGIGGITVDNAADVMNSGADGVAMMRSISEADNPTDAATDFVRIVKDTRLRKAS